MHRRPGRRGAGSAAAAQIRKDPRGQLYRVRPNANALSEREARVQELERRIVQSDANRENRARALLALITRGWQNVQQSAVALDRRQLALRDHEEVLSDREELLSQVCAAAAVWMALESHRCALPCAVCDAGHGAEDEPGWCKDGAAGPDCAQWPADGGPRR